MNILHLNFSCQNCVVGASQSTVVLQVITPVEKPPCPGETIVLSCSIHSSPQTMLPKLFWEQPGFMAIRYHNGEPRSATVGDFTTIASYSNNNYNIVSNATLKGATFSHNGISVSCYSPTSVADKTITIAGILI